MFVEISNPYSYPVSNEFIKRLMRKINRYLKIYRKNKISVALVDNKTIKRINKLYRRKNEVTSILSFSEKDNNKKFIVKEDENYFGEIIIAYPELKRKAYQNKMAVKEQLKKLLIHGLLHLAGYDHLRKEEARRMERLEAIINKTVI